MKLLLKIVKYPFQLFWRVILLPWVWLHYRPTRLGIGNVPRKGGVLLLSNHVSYIDSFIIFLTCPRRVRFVVLERYVENRYFGWFLKLFDAIPIRKTRAKEAIQRTAQGLLDGDVVCLFPEGELTRTGVTNEFRKGFELILRKAKCPVVPVYMDGLFNSIFSFERGLYFKKRPHRWTCPLQVAFGEPIPASEATAERVREAVWSASVEAFEHRRELREPIEVSLIRALSKKGKTPLFTEFRGESDQDLKTRQWTRRQTRGTAVALARYWMQRGEP
ncbi:MAG: 1-acyl-sn-glycerol-3-phosphate acyltransferase, partial [Verrucomicrobiota bacterium]